MGLLSGKRALIFGVANEKSIAWGIARAFHAEGAKLCITYQGDILEKRVRPLAESVGCRFCLPCDVTNDVQIDALYREIRRHWGRFDILVHSVAFAGRDALTGHFYNTSREGFRMALDVSVYSLLAVTRPAVPLLNEGGSILSITYHGSQKVIPTYNVMGVAKAALESSVRYLAFDLGPRDIRVNAISAGPVKTLAASGVGNFKTLFKASSNLNPLKRNVSQEEIGSTAMYLSSHLASGVTGEILYVDAGANIMGALPVKEE
jgi:enoyl-[acyl-carrier protein] reductase I